MIDRQKLIDGYPIADYIRKQGVELKPKGKELVGICPFHDDTNPSMSVNTEKQTFYCFTCGADASGSIIDFAMKLHGLSCKDAMYALAGDIGLEDEPRRVTYNYRDAYGRDVMQVERIEEGRKKKFVQSHIADGEKVMGIQGVERSLFRIERWANEEEIEITEGEKCVAAFEAMGYNATCNSGGANGWLASYATFLRDKHISIWPDRDEAGEKWCVAVMDSLGEIPASIRICRVDAPYNDVADIAVAKGVEFASDAVAELALKHPRIERGHDVPIFSASELAEIYRKEVTSPNPIRMDLGQWLPAFRDFAKPLIPGDVVTFIGATGIGKTAIIQNALLFGTKMPSLLFELELSDYLMAERSMAIDKGMTSTAIEQHYMSGRVIDTKNWSHVWTCPLSNMSVEKMEGIINRAELRMGERPRVVGIDYIGLMKGGQGKRYDRLSTIAEDIKVMAKACGVIVIQLSQVSRPQNKDEAVQEVYLTDAKDSGSIENSSSLVMGVWKTDPKTMVMRPLKNTRGPCGERIECNFRGDKYRITQKIYGVNDADARAG